MSAPKKRQRLLIPGLSKLPPEVVVPVTFTEAELRCIAWAFGAIAWVPAAWRESTDSVAKKLRAHLGDEIVSATTRPT